MNLNRDFKEFVKSFIDRDVRFLIVGGYAVAAHGYPRYTKDLDVWIWADPGNAARVLAALSDFGFGELGLQEADFQRPDTVVQLGREPQRIDILTSLTGLDFEDVYARHVKVLVDDLQVPFIAIGDLRTNKIATGRLQDLADADALRDLPEAES